MQEMTEKCKKCLGCYRLENPEFKGVYRCDYFTEEGRNYEQIQKQKNTN